MKNIEIRTAQNIVISYEIANLQDRILAFVIDMIVISIGMLVFSLVFTLILPDNAIENTLFVFNISLFFFYTLTFEIITGGQTLGKKVLKIRVVSLNGKPSQFTDYATRWAFRMLDIWFSLGSIAVLLAVSGTKGQRLGGMLSNTTVIKERSRLNYKLEDILGIIDKQTHEVRYPEVRQLTEQQVLFLKKSIERYKKYPNAAHKKAITALVHKMVAILGYEMPNKKRYFPFLKAVLRDYIVLTR